MYTLIGSLKSRAVRVLWCLEEIGAEYTLMDAAPGSPEMKAINSSGKVPALKSDDDIINDSAAICTYLTDRHAMLTHPAGSINRAHQDSALFFVLDEMDSILWMAAKHKLFLPENKRASGIEEACAFEFAAATERLSQRIGENEFIFGDSFTVPDIFATHCANWATGMFGWEIPQANVNAYLERNRNRPAYLKAVAMREAA